MPRKRRGKKEVQGDLFASQAPTTPTDPEYLKSKEYLFLSDAVMGAKRQRALEWARSRGERGYTMTEFLDAFDLWGQNDPNTGIVDLAFAALVADSGRSRDYRGGYETVWVAVETPWWKKPVDNQHEPTEAVPCPPTPGPDGTDAASTPPSPPL